jgi:hypothetical protein
MGSIAEQTSSLKISIFSLLKVVRQLEQNQVTSLAHDSANVACAVRLSAGSDPTCRPHPRSSGRLT